MPLALRTLVRAFFLDVPSLIDSAWRRVDVRVNGEFHYRAAGENQTASLERRPAWQRPHFWLFALTMMFIGYGPVWDGLCSVFAPPVSKWALAAVAVLLALVALRLLVAMLAGAKRRIDGRFEQLAKKDDDLKSLAWRGRITWIVSLGLMLVFLVAPFGFATYWLASTAFADPGPCIGIQFSWLSLGRMALCGLAIFAFGIAVHRVETTRRLLQIQFVLLIGVAAVIWFALVPADAIPPGGSEASALPYRHTFALLAPALCFTLWLAPLFASFVLRRAAGRDGIARFAALLPKTELFETRGADPDLRIGRIVYALVHGVLYRPLHFLLPPALLALVARPSWLVTLVLAGSLFSTLMLAWGCIANRWQQMVVFVERWFLRGTALPVSIFVIVIATLRVARIDYVTTIIDAAPFGLLFGIVMMGYGLSWLIEYWLNRALSIELLKLLGSTNDKPGMAYGIAVRQDPHDPVAVELPGRFLMSHAIGRFLVMGRMTPDSIVAGLPDLAFNTYDLHGFFVKLAGGEDKSVDAMKWHMSLYFYVTNAALLAVIAVFGWFHIAHSGPDAVQAVVESTVTLPASGLHELADRLVAAPGVKPRPAFVVVASGGGTRAALYAAHVLEGLHRLGVDGDIVLMSGVSGGGLALTFFAANFSALTRSDNAGAAWQKFKHDVSDNFIQDVLEGATEWRVFGATPLTMLLAESFDRRLPKPGMRFAELSAAPALILNTTIVGHPLEDSDVLARTIDPVAAGDPYRCRHEEQPFTIMNGGRLIFTNVSSTSAFPQRASQLPDTRLPYHIVQDAAIELAKAAALHANFPPVFPNARVRFPAFLDPKKASCPERSYFVTDGGAEENLGLLSALYAVQSALTQIEKTCAPHGPGERSDPGDDALNKAPGAGKDATGSATTGGSARRPALTRPCRANLRPIHFVIAEASATAYDFTQDRGVSAALSGAKQRMTGGLTDTLITSLRDRYAGVTGRQDGVADVLFHYLSLPLVFRARGGFGTHWMHAEHIAVADPRPRAPPGWWRSVAGLGMGTVTLNKDDVARLWTALHQPDPSFCNASTAATWPAARMGNGTRTVWQWICTDSQGAPGARDLHIEQWENLVNALK